jgi:hypothetical protein
MYAYVFILLLCCLELLPPCVGPLWGPWPPYVAPYGGALQGPLWWAHGPPMKTPMGPLMDLFVTCEEFPHRPVWDQSV